MYTQKDAAIEETLNKSYKHQQSMVKQLDVLCHQSYNKYLLSFDVCLLQDKIMSSSGDRPGSPHALKHFSFKEHSAMSTRQTFFLSFTCRKSMVSDNRERWILCDIKMKAE